MTRRTRRLWSVPLYLGAGVAAAALGSPRVATAPSPPSILSQPSNRFDRAFGEPTFLSVLVSGDAPLTSVWYESTVPGDTSHPVASGSCVNACQTQISAENGAHGYWVRVSNPYGHADSQIAIIEVPVPIITAHPQSQTIQSGETATFSVSASGRDGHPITGYQWSVETSEGTWSGVPGTASTYTTPPLTTETRYRARVVMAPYGYTDSAIATIAVLGVPTIATQPQSQVIASGATATMSVAATGLSPLSYQWYVGPSGNTSSPIGGAIATSYTTPPLTTDTNYWVRVANPNGTTRSVTAAITMGVAPGIATQPPDSVACPGGTGTMSVEATGSAPLTYQWYAGVSGDTTTPAGSGNPFTTPPLTTPTSYWARVSNPYGTVDSNAATITTPINKRP